MTPIAEALKPYTLYLIYGQIFLLSLAIFVGALLIIRRLWRREPVDGGFIQDREKLAAEIQEEVLRLQNLRNRLDSSYVTKGEDIAANPVPRVLGVEEPATASLSAEGPAEGLGQAELEAKVHEATQHFTREIAELTEKLSKAEDKLSSAGPEISPAEASDVLTEQERTMAELRDLRDKLEDYQAFEDEIALVKQYKAEIDRLKAMLASSQETPRVSEDDIASLFAEMGSDTARASAPETAPESAAGPEKLAFQAAPKESEPDPRVFAASPGDSETDPLVFAADIAVAPPVDDEPLRKGYVAETRSSEPSMLSEINEDNAEALAELGEDDQLMAEFEKVLNTKEQEKI